ncbi:alpha/beta hydrolase [Rhizobiales bacterium L72]|uniref:Alpha/beta hydrolase n=2 Tax=Propylenella binzhouense TaxID=2555902 RepID=A0A964T2V3_9HYPH|nr:alpha/beta hydrolase [Propylenella binzhouense]
MPLDPVIRAMLDKAAALPPMHAQTVEAVRGGDLARYALVQRPEVGHVEDRTVPGPRGDMKIRIYRPDLRDGRPVVLYFHGGGFVICSIDTHDGICRQICRRAQAIVVSVDYALAPEHKFPAGTDDCLAAARWVAEHAAEFGGDPTRLALAGDSSGGNMAAVTAIRIRDEGGPDVAAQLLIYPVTDHYSAGSASYVERGTGCGLTSETMKWFWGHYLNDQSEGAHPYVSPNRSQNLKSLPPAYIVTAEYDPLRDEGEDYARRLRDAGVDATHIHYGDVHHGFMPWVGIIGRSEEALDAACGWLRDRLNID